MTRFGKRLVAGAVAVTASIGILGCGSSDSAGSASAPPTKAQFLEAGERICQERLGEKDEARRHALNELSASQAAKPSRATLARLGDSILEPVRKLTDEFSELGTPAGSQLAAEITRRLEAGLKQAEADPAGWLQTDPFRKAGKAAGAYGLRACGL
jgi:hypothetical protein